MGDVAAAEAFLNSNKPSEQILTVELARRVAAVVRALPDDTDMNMLYHGVSSGTQELGEAWFELMQDLSVQQRRSLTRALNGVSNNSTVGDWRGVHFAEINNTRMIRAMTAHFLVLVFATADEA